MSHASHPLPLAPASAFDDVPPPPLNVVIAYDEHAAYRTALRMLAGALCEQAGQSEVRPLPWRFDDLRFRPSREQALEQAAITDIFVISVTGRRAVAPGAIKWLADAFEQRAGLSTAVVVLYDVNNDREQFARAFEAAVRHEAELAGLHVIQPVELAAVAC